MIVRRQRLEDSHNHERWLISYSDFMTLLFGFFVVMYAISSVNEGKYRVLSQSLLEVFPQREMTIEPIQVGEPAQSSSPNAITFEQPPAGADAGVGRATTPDDSRGELEASAEDFAGRLAGVLGDGEFSVHGHDAWLEVSLDAAVLFPAGGAELSRQAERVIEDVVVLLAEVDNPITVEGYTDNVEISTERFPSNWELSAARAAAVARAFVRYGIAPERLAVVGYGEQHPVATNATVDGRAANRRVTLVIPRNADVQRGLTTIGADRTRLPPLAWREEGMAPAAGEPPGEAVQAVRRREGGILFTNEAP